MRLDSHCGRVFTFKTVGSETTEFIIIHLELHQRSGESRHFSEVVSIKVQPSELRQVLQQAEKNLTTLSKPLKQTSQGLRFDTQAKLQSYTTQIFRGMKNTHFPITLPSTGQNRNIQQTCEKYTTTHCHIVLRCKFYTWRL